MPDSSTAIVRDALCRADQAHWTRQPPQSDHARLRYLLAHAPDVPVLAAGLHTTPRTVNRVLDQRVRTCGKGLHQAIHAEVARLWQPRVRQRARQRAHGMRVSFRAWFGFDAAAGSSDDGRVRRLCVTLLPHHVELLFQAHARDADENELRHILADAIGAAYFHLPINSSERVRLTDIDYVDFDY